MMKKRFQAIVKQMGELVNSYIFKCDARSKPTYFSREGGKIGFTNMIGITLNFLAKSVQKELNDFFEHVIGKTETVSKQAYNEARHKLTVDAFRIPFAATAKFAAEDADMRTYKGYRVLPVDGSDLLLENTYALRAHYGALGGGDGVAMARASVMADVLNCGLILDARIAPVSCSERELAMLHLERLRELEIENPLPTYDRGYASADLIEAHITKGIDFLFRLQNGFNAKIDRMPLGDITKNITIKKRVFRLRVLKFKLPGGTIETLITSLPRESISADDLAELYNLRWGVETAYGVIKGILQVENFSGTSQLIVEQDFFATMFLKNMVAFAKLDSDEIVEQNRNPQNIYEYTTNTSQLVGLLKDKLVMALLDTNERSQARKVNAVLLKAARFTVPIRPGRSFPRRRKTSNRFQSSGKTVLLYFGSLGCWH